MEFVKTYGGREKYFKRLSVKDCVTRAICNATGNDYLEIYQSLKSELVRYRKQQNNYSSKKRSPRNGIPGELAKDYVDNILKWKYHKAQPGENILNWKYDSGIYIVNMTHHFTCIKEGKLYDSWNCQEGKKSKAILGYWTRE